MSETIPSPAPPSAPPTSAPIVYKPVSGFAIGGFVAACLFTLLVLGMAALALIQGTPVFFSPWVLVLPAAGFCLSLFARGQIRGSEGTRAGEPLARAGIWLSLFMGLGYAVYYYVTGLAVVSQANTMMTEMGPESGFFPHLLKAAESPADFNAAFILTLPASSRVNGIRPDDTVSMQKYYDAAGADGAPGRMTQFRQSVIGKMFLTPGQKVDVESLGVLNWEYDRGSYTVRRGYRVTTPEAVCEFSVLVRSSEGETAGAERKWFVDLTMTSKPIIKLTPLGHGIALLRNDSKRFFESWKMSLITGKTIHFAGIDKTDWPRLSLTDRQQGAVRAGVEDMFNGDRLDRLSKFNLTPGEELANWEIVDGKVRIAHPFKFSMMIHDVAYSMEGAIVTETKERIDPLSASAPPQWTIDSFKFTRIAVLTSPSAPRKAVP